jgi:hypothetical protein
MQRRQRSVPHSFEAQIVAEKCRLEAQAAGLPSGPQKGHPAQEDQAARNSLSHERVADVSRITATDLNDKAATVGGSVSTSPATRENPAPGRDGRVLGGCAVANDATLLCAN